MVDESNVKAFRSDLLRLILNWQATPGDVLGALAEFDAEGLVGVDRVGGQGDGGGS